MYFYVIFIKNNDMRNFSFLLSVVFLLTITPTLNGKKNCTQSNYYYTFCSEHLFTHCLIAYPEIAFRTSNSMRQNYDTDCITPKEFISILNSLHANNYILVSLEDCFTITDGVAVKNKVKVPVGKKPIVISFDDVNYDHKKMGLGMVDKLIIDEYGEIATQTIIDGNVNIRYDNEFLPILENFIKIHPDFSPYGARGTINLTGYDGILGYRTSHNNTNDRYDEITEAKKVVNKIKSLGWTFACHSYGHYHMKKISDEKFLEEITLWKNEVEPIIGKTDVYVYPYGEWEVFNNGEYTYKHQLLIENGYRLFCGVGMKTFFSFLPNKNGKKVLFMDRKVIDGTTLKGNNENLLPFFNPLEVIDNIRKF